LVVVLHVAALYAWISLPPSDPAPPRETEVTVALAMPPAAQPESLPEPRPPKPVPQPRKAAPAPEPLPVQAESKPSETPVEQPVLPVPVAAPKQVAAAPAPMAAPPVVAPPSPPDVEPDYKASYLNNPRPSYPPAAKRMGLQGRVMLNVEVLAEGSCGQVNVAQSSGHEMLDKAALQAVKTWKFAPARQAGRAITKWCQVPINFTLKDNEA
jgi:periplasmic protein TonB